MKLVRFIKGHDESYGILEGHKIHPIQGDVFGSYTETVASFDLQQVKLLAPCKPTKVICVGLNYRDHAEEMKHLLPQEPVLFMKPNTAIIGPGEEIVFPQMAKQVDYEAELALVIGRQAKNLEPNEAKEVIFGYTCANDVTARDLQSKDGQWTRAKSFDTFLPLGPYIDTEINPQDLGITLKLNGLIKQNARTSAMIYSPQSLVSFISKVMTLYPGDVILTGTPSGIGPMEEGDEVVVAIEGLGELINKIVKKP